MSQPARPEDAERGHRSDSHPRQVGVPDVFSTGTSGPVYTLHLYGKGAAELVEHTGLEKGENDVVHDSFAGQANWEQHLTSVPDNVRSSERSGGSLLAHSGTGSAFAPVRGRTAPFDRRPRFRQRRSANPDASRGRATRCMTLGEYAPVIASQRCPASRTAHRREYIDAAAPFVGSTTR
jgi:hypothetical protein